MATISDLQRPAAIDGPEDPGLATLWALAVAKFETRTAHPAESRADWREVVADYSQLLKKTRGPISQIIQRCAEVPGGD